MLVAVGQTPFFLFLNALVGCWLAGWLLVVGCLVRHLHFLELKCKFVAPFSTLCHSCHFPVFKSWAKAFFVVWPCIICTVYSNCHFSTDDFSSVRKFSIELPAIVHSGRLHCAVCYIVLHYITVRCLLHCVILRYIAIVHSGSLHCAAATKYLCPSHSSECCKGSCANLEVQGRD